MSKTVANCRSCEAEIVWLKTKKGKNIPCDAGSVEDNNDGNFKYGTHVVHFDTCPDADQYRQRQPQQSAPQQQQASPAVAPQPQAEEDLIDLEAEDDEIDLEQEEF